MANRVRYACEWNLSGIAVAAQRSMRALIDTGVDIAWEPLANAPSGRVRTTESGDAPAWMRALRRREVDDEVLVIHSVPFAWDTVVEQLRAPYRIGQSVWELEEVPPRFVQCMDPVDEIWVPTEWNKAAYEQAFDKPIHVVPHATAGVTPGVCPVDVPDDCAVILLDAAWDWRKRPDRAIEAYLRAFSATDPVTLVIKTTDWCISWPGGPIAVRQLIDRIVGRFENPAQVIVETRHFDAPQMLGLIARSACTLSLTASEGWGLGAFDAATLGVPVIITGYGGQAEFLGADYPGLLPFRMVPTNHPDQSIFVPGSHWAYADMDSAVDLLRAVVNGSATALQARASSLAAELDERFGPKAVGELTKQLLPAPTPTSIPQVMAQPAEPTIAILTPVKNAAHHASGFVDRILGLQYPRSQLSVAVLASDCTDDTVEAFTQEFIRLEAVGVTAQIFTRDFGYSIPEGVPRWQPDLQLQRRTVLAKSRNHLLFRGLGDAEWALWIDADVVAFPADVIQQLLAVDGDIVHPNCVDGEGRGFDLNAWTDHGRWHLEDYAGHGRVELHAVGGTMLLVRGDCHRDGLIWPAHLHGVPNVRVRQDPVMIGRPEIGELETEGLAILADDMGLTCWGLPDLVITHE